MQAIVIDHQIKHNPSCGHLHDCRTALWFGQRLPRMDAWLDENCAADGWAMTPLGGAVAIYFGDATFASAFVARWCAGSSVAATRDVFQVSEDERTPQVGARQHSIP